MLRPGPHIATCLAGEKGKREFCIMHCCINCSFFPLARNYVALRMIYLAPYQTEKLGLLPQGTSTHRKWC